MIPRRASLDEGALGVRPHSLDGVGMVDGEVNVTMFSVRKKSKKKIGLILV
jgi:hypothetical protein